MPSKKICLKLQSELTSLLPVVVSGWDNHVLLYSKHNLLSAETKMSRSYFRVMHQKQVNFTVFYLLCWHCIMSFILKPKHHVRLHILLHLEHKNKCVGNPGWRSANYWYWKQLIYNKYMHLNKHHRMIKDKLREVGRVMIEVKRINNSIKYLQDLIHPKSTLYICLSLNLG